MKRRILPECVPNRVFRGGISGLLLLAASVVMSGIPTTAAGNSGASQETGTQQQNVNVSGMVKDPAGNALPGVNVTIKGTYTGVASDGNGRYSITAPEGGTLLFSYLGYITREVEIPAGGNLDVILHEDALSMTEIIVTGVAAGTPKQKLGFSIDKVSSDKLMQVPAIDPAAALQGKVAGLMVTKTSGAPGAESDIQLRGAKTIYGSSNPLYIIDGVLTENGMSHINVEDIESMEVLKGSAASSLYGSRAANGVISIITKRGTGLEAGTVQVDFRTEYGKNTLGFIPKRSGATNRLIENGEVVYGTIKPDQVYDNPYPRTYDHVKQFFDPGNYFTAHLGVRATTNDNRISVYSSMQTTNEGGVVKMVDGMKRTNIRLNVDMRLAKNLVFTTSNLFSRTKTDDRANNVFGSLFRSDPGADLLAPNDDGSPYKVNANRINNTTNPLYTIANTINESSSDKLMSYFQLKYDPTDYLTFSTSYGTTRGNGESFSMTPKGVLNYDLTRGVGSIYRSTWKSIEQTFNVDAMFHKKFGDFNTRLKAQYIYESSNSSSLWGGGNDLGIGGTNVKSLALAKVPYAGSGLTTEIANNYALLAVLDYKDKYIFDGLVRRDGSSLFGSDVRWHTFYRVSGAWRITQDFEINGINEWKLRASYGVAGLRPPFEAQYETFELVAGVTGAMTTLGNTMLKPSLSREFEVGTDLYFLDRFNFTFNYARANNTDQILKVKVPALAGASIQWQNAGTLQTQSFEASLGADVIRREDMNWNLNLTFDKFTQKVTKLNSRPYMLDGTRFRIEEGVKFGVLYLDKFARTLDDVKNQVPEGRTIDELFVVNNQGFVVRRDQIGTVNETPVKIKDDNGNIVSLPTKSMTPNFNLNLASSFRYKNLSFYMLWAYQNGGYTYNHMVRYTTEPALFDQTGKAWNEVKAATYYSNGGQEIGMLGWDNDVLLYDASFLKLRELSLSYDFKIKGIEKFVKNIRVSFICRNLLTFTKYPGFDPEGVSGRNDLGVDTNVLRLDSNESYPLYRTFSGSIAFRF